MTHLNNQQLKSALTRFYKDQISENYYHVYQSVAEGVLWAGVNHLPQDVNPADILRGNTNIEILTSTSPHGGQALLLFSDRHELNLHIHEATGLTFPAINLLRCAIAKKLDGVVVNPGSDWIFIPLKHVEALLAHGENEFEICLKRGAMFCEIGKHDCGIREFLRAKEIDQYSAIPILNLAHAYHALGSQSDAVKMFRLARAEECGDAQDLIPYAWALFSEGQFDDALKLSNNLLTQNPGDAKILNLHGSICDALGRYDEAIVCFESALEELPDSAQLYSNLGITNLSNNNLDCAQDALNRALTIDPTCPLAHYNMAFLKIRQNEIDQALEHLSIAIDLNPEYKIAASKDAGLACLKEQERFVELVALH